MESKNYHESYYNLRAELFYYKKNSTNVVRNDILVYN